MNIWEVTHTYETWDPPIQTVMVATETHDILDAIDKKKEHFPTGLILGIKYLGFAHK